MGSQLALRVPGFEFQIKGHSLAHCGPGVRSALPDVHPKATQEKQAFGLKPKRF